LPLDARSARRLYDRVGRAQDSQRFYEDKATDRLARLVALSDATAVFELGCGTGRYAAGLLAHELPKRTRYMAADVSATMVGLARRRLASWAPRAEVRLLEPPALQLPGDDRSFDRFLSTYVFDLLSDDHAQALTGEAHRLLAPGGRVGLVSLTHGTTPSSKLLSSAWGALAARWPQLVGGCRPVELRHLIASPRWRIDHREVVVSWGVPSEVLVATKVETP
jgi:ubiquinone/menaquinone biosynthesis C-methylase UbiE